MSRKKHIYDLVFVILAGVFVFYLSENPIYNWDMVAYMGVVEEYSDHDIQHIHHNVYNALHNEVPPKVFQGLTENIEDRKECLVDPNAFCGELSFFRTKPLYTFFVFLIHKTGVHIVLATLIPSMIGAFFLIAIAYGWLTKYLTRPFALIIASLLMCLPIFGELVESSTPDALSNMLILLSLYIIANKKPAGWLGLCLLAAILARVDNIVFAAIVAYYAYLQHHGSALMRVGIIVLLLGTGLIGIPMLLGNAATWFTKFSFLFSLTDYVKHVRDMLYIVRTDLTYLSYALICLFLMFKGDRDVRKIIYVICTTILIRLFLFPSLQERFFGAYEFAILIMLVCYLSARYNKQVAFTQTHMIKQK